MLRMDAFAGLRAGHCVPRDDVVVETDAFSYLNMDTGDVTDDGDPFADISPIEEDRRLFTTANVSDIDTEVFCVVVRISILTLCLGYVRCVIYLTRQKYPFWAKMIRKCVRG